MRFVLSLFLLLGSLVASEPLAYTKEGRGNAVVLLHGLGGNRSVWAEWGKRLKVGHTLLTVDLPGHGDSAAPPLKGNAVDLDAVARDLAQLIRKQKMAPALLIGHSLGGALALRIAAVDPEAVQGVLLLDGFLSPLPAATVASMAEGVAQDSKGTLRAFFNGMSAGAPQTEMLLKTASKVKPEVLAAYFRALGGPALEVSRVKASVTLFASSFLIPDPNQEAEALTRLGLKGLPKLQVQYFVNAHHWIMLDEREALDVLFNDFETSILEGR